MVMSIKIPLREIKGDKIVEIYYANNCDLTKTAQVFKCSRQTLKNRIEKDSILTDMINDANESLLDTAESELHKLVNKGDFKAIKFTLERKGRSRGYGNTVEITGDSTKPLQFITAEMSVEEAQQAWAQTLTEDYDNVDDL